ncbi:RagB/SusD family nutrient uptake outer membrane protein [Marivirga sp. S37H4]|uniref:RagB/SusD family nutrient uptake outer membrane protein n=1 Tax=Marivirga aurantiaca TaxID=2802615 RepID=A0A934WWF6_9BACT|nr:RagB/SusD family nutrient uptake outer membrane protein [Marivirga aurantiaca]MBK6264338.1 RagB/SusD family nutrient uptake outer membrane protein [Marivirga aurantiaca]
MKTNLKYIALLLTGMFLTGACSDEFLEVEPKGRSLEDNYYRNAEEAYKGLIAAYDPIGWVGGNLITKTFATNSASDDHVAGGGNANDITAAQVWSSYSLDAATGPQDVLWSKGFSGIFRANKLLEKLPEAEMNEGVRERFAAEARFLRAFYYFDLIRLFDLIPLLTEPIPSSEMYNVEQASREAVFEQIEIDLLAAIPNLPTQVDKTTEAGRASAGTALALLGKVYLQQEKFGQATEQLAKVNGTPGATSEYGYRLVDNFADLWDSNNKFNSEAILEVSHTSLSNGVWDCIGCTEGNVLNIMLAPRGYSIENENAGAPNFVSGWGFNPVTESLAQAFQLGGGLYDPRYTATVVNLDSLEAAGVVSYEKSYQNTGYFLRKFAGKQDDVSEGGGNYELNFFQDTYEIRLADTYLMEAEAIVRGGGDAGRAQALLDAVRARVGLGSVPVSFDNIMSERRLELAGEGHRWFDLVRTGRAAQALEDRGYVEGKHDKLPIPLLELTNTLLEQDPAY